MAEFAHVISTVDVHTAGEPTRIVLSGVPQPRGATMAARKQRMAEQLDHLRTTLLHEPRGHRDMFGALLVAPVTEGADHGLIFMDSSGYIDMCGHAVMGVTTALVELGMVRATEPVTTLVFDTPAGRVESRARVEGTRATHVTVENVHV